MAESVGRPSLYKPEYADQALRLCLLGATDAELGEFFGVSETTVNNWKQAHPEFLVSLRAGKQDADSQVAKALYDKAKGGDVPAATFWLKNRRARDWRDKQEVEHAGKDGGPIEVKVTRTIVRPGGDG